MRSDPWRFWLAAVAFAFPLEAAAEPPSKPVTATVETSLTSASGHIRQFALDGDDNSYFASTGNAGADDHFTLVFDKPVAIKLIVATTGRPKGGDALHAGILEASEDGKKFAALAKFADGEARAKSNGRSIVALRIKPAESLKHPLTIREIKIDSDPPVAVFMYPVEFVVDCSDAPEMKEWAMKAARICERQYAMINKELQSDGFKPATVISLSLKTNYEGVAATSGNKIVGSVSYFKSHPEDFGAMVHETTHCVQAYRARNNPGWLVEGIADYIRFFKYEPGQIGRINPGRARYDGSYRVTAAFLAYLTAEYDKDIVRKLNKVMREGEYKEEVFKLWTKKPLKELGEEWRASLRK
jgi:hypothetical protein